MEESRLRGIRNPWEGIECCNMLEHICYHTAKDTVVCMKTQIRRSVQQQYKAREYHFIDDLQ